MVAQQNQPKTSFIDGITGALGIAASLLTPNRRSQRVCWGATVGEQTRRLPGDERVQAPKWSYTHAITINAPVTQIWPWLVQIGQGRGGMYSYESLENIAGSQIHNADQILPEFQQVKLGESISFHPSIPALEVGAMARERYLLLVNKQNDDAVGNNKAGDKNVSWLFYLENPGDDTTRLLTRYRIDYAPTLVNRLGFGPLLIEPISFVMERKMLLSLKQRAEAAR